MAARLDAAEPVAETARTRLTAGRLHEVVGSDLHHGAAPLVKNEWDEKAVGAVESGGWIRPATNR